MFQILAYTHTMFDDFDAVSGSYKCVKHVSVPVKYRSIAVRSSHTLKEHKQ